MIRHARGSIGDAFAAPDRIGNILSIGDCIPATKCTQADICILRRSPLRCVRFLSKRVGLLLQ